MQVWFGYIWVNPPYHDSEIDRWCKKGCEYERDCYDARRGRVRPWGGRGKWMIPLLIKFLTVVRDAALTEIDPSTEAIAPGRPSRSTRSVG
jgi:hypothetical protein